MPVDSAPRRKNPPHDTRRQSAVAAEAETQREHSRPTVEHDAATELISARPEIIAEESTSEAKTERIEAKTERIEARHTIKEKARALTYAINARMGQLEQERQNATLWWKILDTVFRRAGAQQQRLQEVLKELDTVRTTTQHPAIHEQTLARLAELEHELYNTHNVPEVLAAPQAEYEGEPIVRASLVGKMKPTHGTVRVEGKKLGRYGQDGVRINEASATSIVYDGVGSFEDSYLVGEKIAAKAEEILHGLPDTTNTDLIELYIQQRYPEIAAEMTKLPETTQGAAVFIAKRFLPKSELLVVIKVGDGEIVIERPNGFVNELLRNDEVENVKATEINLKRDAKRRELFGIGIMDKTPRYIDQKLQENVQRKLVSTPYHIIVTPAHKGDKIRTTTDGFYNNTGMHLIDAIKKGQFAQLQENLTSKEDDVVVLTEEL